MIKFSSAELIKSYARQIWYYDHINPLARQAKIGPLHHAGEAFQHKQAISPFQEMKGSYLNKDIQFYWCIDELRSLDPETNSSWIAIEYKNLSIDTHPRYLFESAVLQVCLYQSLHNLSNKEYVTAEFHREKGFPLYKGTIDHINEWLLQ